MIDHITATINRHHQKAIFVLITIGILLLSFGIYTLLTPTVRITWTTESEIETIGFDLIREDLSEPENGQQINPQLILSQGSPISGTNYHFMDRDVQAGKFYTYHLLELNNSNEIVELESIEIRVNHKGIVEIGIALVMLTLAILLYSTMHKTHTGDPS